MVPTEIKNKTKLGLYFWTVLGIAPWALYIWAETLLLSYSTKASAFLIPPDQNLKLEIF